MKPHTTKFYAFHGILYIHVYISIRTTSDKVRMRQMFHVKHGVDAPPTTCKRSPKNLKDSYRYQRVFSREGTMVGTTRSIEITKVSYHGS